MEGRRSGDTEDLSNHKASLEPSRKKGGIETKCGLPWWPSGHKPPADAGVMGSISGSRRSPGEGNSYPL